MGPKPGRPCSSLLPWTSPVKPFILGYLGSYIPYHTHTIPYQLDVAIDLAIDLVTYCLLLSCILFNISYAHLSCPINSHMLLHTTSTYRCSNLRPLTHWSNLKQLSWPGGKIGNNDFSWRCQIMRTFVFFQLLTF